MDEPTELPDGTEVELAAVEDERWELTAEQRKELKARLTSSDSTKNVRAADVIARLRVG